jgi:flavin reductase (DIM6/NTAB) family NADH-FMN oxidoreductase RutF
MNPPAETSPEMSPKVFWEAIGCRAAAAAIVTVDGAEGPAGFLALSSTHLTASPPTVTVSLDKKTSAAADLLAKKAFAINYLSADGRALFDLFTSRDGPKGAARFHGLATSKLVTGAPVLPHITGVLDCEIEEVIDRYGVYLVIGKIVAFESDKEARPLMHYQGKLVE